MNTIGESSALCLPASVVAAQTLEALETGRIAIRFGSQNKKIAQSKAKLLTKKTIILSVLVCLSIFYFGIEFSKPLITGFITNNRFDSKRKRLNNSKVLFENEKVYICYTNEEGNFSIRLPKGEYGVSAIVDEKELKSPIKLKCVESNKIRVFIPYWKKLMFKVRFHLASGKNYKKWQITSIDGTKQYHEPENTNLKMIDCKLKNNKKTAQKIFDGENKTVCAWIECRDVIVTKTKTHDLREIQYNPKKAPHWTDQNGNNIDNEKFSIIISDGKQLFV